MASVIGSKLGRSSCLSRCPKDICFSPPILHGRNTFDKFSTTRDETDDFDYLLDQCDCDLTLDYFGITEDSIEDIEP